MTSFATAGGGATLATLVTPTGVSVVDFIIPGGVKRIFIMYKALSFATTPEEAHIVLLGDSGGFETTGYIGQVAQLADSGVFSNVATEYIQATRPMPDALTVSGLLTLALADASSNLWTWNSVISAANTGTGIQISAGHKALSGTLTQVRITSILDVDFDSGSINIQYSS
jgi:hypothetical protein